MWKYLVEFIGTFFLVATIGGTVLQPNGAGDLAPLAIGATLMVMIFAGGHISGGHYNPAVTLAVFLRGKCGFVDALVYMVVQVIGAVAASVVMVFLKGSAAAETMTLDVNKALVAEFMYTFALCYVVLNVATAKGTFGNSFYGLAIGFTVLAGAYSVGSISGGAFNPAVAVGFTAMRLSAPAHLWVYLAANFAGGAVAALIFRAINPDDK